MSNYIETAEKMNLPLIPLRGTVAFPNVQLNVDILSADSLRAFGAAVSEKGTVFLVAQKNPNETDPTPVDFFKTGTVAQIRHVAKNPDGHLTVTFEGLCRASVTLIAHAKGFFRAQVVRRGVHLGTVSSARAKQLTTELFAQLEALQPNHPLLTEEMILAARALQTASELADFVASGALLHFESKQTILDCINPTLRLDKLCTLLEKESEMVKCELDIRRRVHERIDEQHRDYFLREQIKVIQQELGEDADEIEEYEAKIRAKKLPDYVYTKLMKELSRLDKTPFGSPESTVLRNYLDACLELPFGVTDEGSADVLAVQKILDADHDGLVKVKERILEFAAVRQLAPDVKNQILCLVGPPGVGKTSIAASVARALKRKYARISLGGVRDEADIRGHRKTYIGAMPGRLVEALTAAGTMNPVIVLDEIDKLSHSLQGDPASALLEVLDPEQNKHFRDHFLELPLDLSDCLFIATANTAENIPDALYDRMEIIELSSYTRTEKAKIARNHLLPKQLARHGLNKRTLKITDEALYEIIDFYTREAGVRTLERTIASICRKVARRIAEGSCKSYTCHPKQINQLLGKRKYFEEVLETENPVGVVNGLAYTAAGGDLLKVEVSVLEGSGVIETTGSLGDVMKESAKLAVSYVRSIAADLGLPGDFYKKADIHIHFPEGAVPKDGPSAGVTMVCALVSALTNRPTRRDVAMTGEISLRGRVLPIGGLKEKTMAAYRTGIKTVLIPRENQRDLDDIDAEAREHLQFILCDNVQDNLGAVLLPAIESDIFPFLFAGKEDSTHTVTAIPAISGCPMTPTAVTGSADQ